MPDLNQEVSPDTVSDLKQEVWPDVVPELKQEVIFRQFNLMDPFPFKKKMHVVFLRNVMIYFDEPTKQEVVQKVYNSLVPGGYLFIGTTETIDRGTTPFQIVQPSIFRKREGNV